MTRLTRKNELEQRSKITFQKLILPWESENFDHDTGIDLIVQPYDEQRRDLEDKSLPPFERRFLVQLKSTESETLEEKHNQGKLQIDTEHLKSWSKQKDPVMIARYYLNNDCFYFAWISEINIKEDQETQVIILLHRFDDIVSLQVRENILEYLIPPDISKLIYVPIDRNVRNAQQLLKIIESTKSQHISETVVRAEINSLKHKIAENGLDAAMRFKLAVSYIKLKDWNESLSELNVLANTFSSIEARILSSIILLERYDIFNSLNEFQFIYYLVFEGMEPENQVFMSLDGNEYSMGHYKVEGMRFPKQDFKKIDYIRWKVGMKNKTHLGEGYVSKTTFKTEYPVTLMRSLADGQNIFNEHGVIIAKDKLKISSISVN